MLRHHSISQVSFVQFFSFFFLFILLFFSFKSGWLLLFFLLYCFIYPGIAIYFISPLWPYLVNTAVSLDSGPITLIDLVDHSSPSTGQGPETIQYQVVWHTTELANTHHNLLISVGAGQPYAVVDGLMCVLSLSSQVRTIDYSVFDYGSYTTATNVSSSTSSSLLPTSTLPVSIVPSSTASATLSPKSKSKPIVAIALGSSFGVLGLLIILGGVWYIFRRRKRPNSEAWTLGGSSFTTSMSRNPSVSAVGPNASDKNGNWSAEQLYNNGYYMNQSNDGKSWHNPRYEYVGMPAPPIPSYQRGYQNDISSRTAMHQHQMTGRTSNRYEPGCTLSTITERSTPQMGEGRTPLGNSPTSYQSDLEYYTAQGSEASYSVSRMQQEQQPPSPNTPRYSSQRRKPVEYNWFIPVMERCMYVDQYM